MVDGPGRGRPSFTWFLAGALVGGVTTGTVLEVVAMLIPSVPWWLAFGMAGLTAILVLLRDTNLIGVPFPQNPRQVRQSVIHLHPVVGASMFGFELGSGVRTHLTGAAPYIVIVGVLMADVYGRLPGVLAGLGFGLGRGLVPLERRTRGHDGSWSSWIRRYGRTVLPVLSALATALAAAATFVV